MKGKVALVTGASEGMGKATSFLLSEHGIDVILAARRLELTEKYAREIKERFGTDPLAVKMDIGDQKEVDDGVRKAVNKFGRVDFAVNFAGNPAGYKTGFRKKAIHELTDEEVRSILDVDFWGTFRVNRAVVPHMIRQKSGVVINISAVTTVFGFPEDGVYTMAKRAHEAITINNALRSERDGWGLKFYTIAPGDVFNPSTWDAYDEEERKSVLRYGTIESKTMAKVVYWLFTDKIKEKYEITVDPLKWEVSGEVGFSHIRNGDIIVVDAHTVPKLFESIGESYRPFTPQNNA